MQSRSEVSVTPLLRDVALESDAPDNEDPLAAALAEAGLGPKSVGSTPVRNVVNPILSPSEDIPLLMDVIAVDPTPEEVPASTGNDIPEVNSVIALPEKLSAAAGQALGSSNERAPSLAVRSEAAPPLSLAETPPVSLHSPAEQSMSVPLGFADSDEGAEIPAAPADAENTEGTEVLDDAALLALLNTPTQPSTQRATAHGEDVPPDIALGHGDAHVGADTAPEGEPLEFSSITPPLENVEAPTSQLIARLKLVEQEMPDLSLPSIPMTPAPQAAESSPAAQLAPASQTPQSGPASNELNGTVNAAAQTIAGELQQQLYRKIDSLILETVDSFTRDLNNQLGARIEAMVLAAIDDTLPSLLEQLSVGLHNELRPKLQSKVPELLAEVMSRRG